MDSETGLVVATMDDMREVISDIMKEINVYREELVRVQEEFETCSDDDLINLNKYACVLRRRIRAQQQCIQRLKS